MELLAAMFAVILVLGFVLLTVFMVWAIAEIVRDLLDWW